MRCVACAKDRLAEADEVVAGAGDHILFDTVLENVLMVPF